VNCRFLYLVGQLSAGGLEAQLYYLLKGLDRTRYQPAVAVWNLCQEATYVRQILALGIPVYSFPSAASSMAKLLAFQRLVKKLGPEVVHSYSFYTNFPSWWATRNTNSIAIGSIRNNFTTERRSPGLFLGCLCSRYPTTHICNSEAAMRAVENTPGLFKPKKLQLVRNKLDLDRFRAVYTLPNSPQLLAVGRLHRSKRWDRLLKVVAMVAAKRLRFLVRHAGEGSLLEELKTQAKLLEIDDLVQFLGHRDDISMLLHKSSFLIHTADDEGCPNVVMEAMACGRAVVATDAGEVPNLVEDGATGFVIRRGDDEMLAERVATLISDAELCRRMGEAGRAKAKRDFGANPLAVETLDAYRALGWMEA